MFDSHVHSSLSFDGKETIDAFCRKASGMQMKELCFTEHVELGHIYQAGWDGTVDFAEYGRQLQQAREAYPQLRIRQGVEVGLQPGTLDKTKAYLQGRPLDFIIASQHVAGGRDPYSDRAYFDDRPVKTAVQEFLEETLRCLQGYDLFDVIGHISFVSLYGPDPKPVEYGDYADVLDEILQLAIDRGKGIEVNTIGYHIFDAPLASYSVLKRFRELGGEIVTVGSDAHYLVALGYAYKAAVGLVKAAGFGAICTFEGRRPVFHKID